MKYRPMSRCGAHTVYAVLVLLVVELTGCGAQAPTSHPGGNSAAAATSPPSPCPESPPGGSPPSPPPALGGDLKLPASPCPARYEGIADVRGLTTFTMTIGRAAPGEPYFAPTLLEGAAGESLRLHIVNTTPALHNMSVPVTASMSPSLQGAPSMLSGPSRLADLWFTIAPTTPPKSRLGNSSRFLGKVAEARRAAPGAPAIPTVAPL
jgi:hypothetical protein